jgi:hypothetical protein
MGKQEDANLILKLYELRRDETMRKARDWYAVEFHPTSAQDCVSAILGPNSNYYRMVTSYWEMAASFVNHGAIDEQMFNDANGEHIAVFAKIEPFLPELREAFGIPNYLRQLEALVMRLPDAKQRLAAVRDRIKKLAEARAELDRQLQARAAQTMG